MIRDFFNPENGVFPFLHVSNLFIDFLDMNASLAFPYLVFLQAGNR